MRHHVQWLLLFLPSLTACSDTDNHFTEIHFLVEDDGRIARADVHLCGRKASLSKHGWEFIGKARVDCEGRGAVLVHLKDGRVVSCEVGYVTPKTDEAFRFKLQGTECRLDMVIGFM